MEVDVTEEAATVAGALGMLIADLGRWLCELEERIARLEAEARAHAAS